MTNKHQLASKLKKAKIFISYKRDSGRDETIATELAQALGQHTVFIDQVLQIGAEWAKRIEEELHKSDFLIALLSEQSTSSEMVIAEIETAHRLKQLTGKPIILPVRLAYSDPFKYPLSAYLNQINWASWRNSRDTLHLIEQLEQAISSGKFIAGSLKTQNASGHSSLEIPPPLPLAQPLRLEMPEGTMNPESSFYVIRPTDLIALDIIKKQGITMSIKGPRQMGKSSLLMSIISSAMQSDKRVAFLDFQLFEQSALMDASTFFRQFSAWLTDELGIEDKVEEYWSNSLGNSQRCTRYIGQHILSELGRPLVLAMDEVESIPDSSFRSDFFSMLRAWHNKRLQASVWRQLDLLLVTSTEQLVEDLNRSPFNVGEVLNLEDFTPDQVRDLNQRHGSPLNCGEEKELFTLIGGHPYLIRRALYLIASQRFSPEELFSKATDDKGPFSDHLRHHLFRLQDKAHLIQGLRNVIVNNTCKDERVFYLLQGAGLVRRDGCAVVPRCQLYAKYFKEHFHVKA